MIGAEEVSTAQSILVPVGSVVGGVLAALLLAAVVGTVVRSVARRSTVAADLARRSRQPLRAVLVVIAVWVALLISVPDATWTGSAWMDALEHTLRIALIAAATWLVGTLAFVVEDVALSRYRVDMKDNRHARRVRTQIQLLRRITVAALVVVAVAAVLLTFPGVSTFGASLLASAGVLSIVAGLAAQSTLSNVFAGLQLAFTDAIRVDDVVIVSDEWGRIEEITLTYVVVHVWDDRRLILPSTYFTETPFENWTRRAAELLGTVELDVDWQVPVDAMRAELNRLLAATDLWDERVGILQVTDAVGGVVRLRALASAVDAPTLFDLRCYLREGLVAWLQRTAPQGLPRTRVETSQAASVPTAPPAPAGPAFRAGSTWRVTEVPAAPAAGQQDARLFTGSVAALERSRSFTGPGSDVIEEREEHAAEARGEKEPAEPTPPRTSGGPDEPAGAAPAGAALSGTALSGAAPAGAAPGAAVAEPADAGPADAGPADAGPADAVADPAEAGTAGPGAGDRPGRRVVSSPGTDTATGVTRVVPANLPPGPEPIAVPGRPADEPSRPVRRVAGHGPTFAETQQLRADELRAAAGTAAEPGPERPAADPAPDAGTGSGTIVLPAVPADDADPDGPAAPPTRRSVRDEPR